MAPNSSGIFHPKVSQQYSDRNSWRILFSSDFWRILKFINFSCRLNKWLHDSSSILFPLEFWSKKNLFHFQNRILNEFQNYLMCLPLKITTSILVKICEEFHRNSEVSYSYITKHNSDRNSWRIVIWICDFLKKKFEDIFFKKIYQLFLLADILFSHFLKNISLKFIINFF